MANSARCPPPPATAGHPPPGTSSRGVYQLRPVSFRYKQDPQGVKQYGLVAEEVAGVYPELVIKGEKGEIEGVQYQGLIPLLVNEVQHQQQELGTQARQLTTQSQELAALRAQNVAWRRRMRTYGPSWNSSSGRMKRSAHRPRL